MSTGPHPLSAAARLESRAEVRRLLAEKPSEEACRQALWAALEKNALDTAELLAPHIGPLDTALYAEALKRTAAAGNLSAVRALLKVGVRKKEAPALQAAAENGHADVVRLLARRRTPLQVGKVLLDTIVRSTPAVVAALLAAKWNHDDAIAAFGGAAMLGRSAVVDAMAPFFKEQDRVDALIGCLMNHDTALVSTDGLLRGAREIARTIPVEHLRALPPHHLALLPEAHARVLAAALGEEMAPSPPRPARRRRL